jgi:hypothetical protein
MLYLKSCPRSAGDINADSDMHGMFLKCLQCGFSKDLSPEMARNLFGGQDEAPEVAAAQADQKVACTFKRTDRPLLSAPGSGGPKSGLWQVQLDQGNVRTGAMASRSANPFDPRNV